jgi:hypothetical protein
MERDRRVLLPQAISAQLHPIVGQSLEPWPTYRGRLETYDALEAPLAVADDQQCLSIVGAMSKKILMAAYFPRRGCDLPE